MQDKIEEIKKQAEEKIKEIKNSQELQELKVKMLGKKSELSNLLKGLGALTAEERPKVGALVNEARKEIEEKLSIAEEQIKSKMLEEKWGVSAAAAVGILAVLLVDDGPAFCGFVPQKVARPRYGAVVILAQRGLVAALDALGLLPRRRPLLQKIACACHRAASLLLIAVPLVGVGVGRAVVGLDDLSAVDVVLHLVVGEAAMAGNINPAIPVPVADLGVAAAVSAADLVLHPVGVIPGQLSGLGSVVPGGQQPGVCVTLAADARLVHSCVHVLAGA